MYAKYHVTAVDVEATFIGTHATQTGLCGLLFGDDSFNLPVSGTQYQQAALERPELGAHSFLNAAPNEHSTVVLRAHKSLSDVAGRELANDYSNSAAVVGSPALNIYCDAYVVNADGTTVGITAQMIIRIAYHVRFFGRQSMIED